MRNSRSWKSDLLKGLSGHATNPEVLCDVELALTLVSEMCPEEPPAVVPALLSGNPFSGLTPTRLTAYERGLLARARVLLRCRGEMRWRAMLRSYNSESEVVRMYDVSDDGPVTRKQTSIYPTRHQTYIAALTSSPAYSDRALTSAAAGTYWFPARSDSVRGALEWHSVSFTDEAVQNVPGAKARPLRPPRGREPLSIPWAALKETARWMDLQVNGRWLRRLDGMRVDTSIDGHASQQDLTLDGLFQLVGMVSSGKSTLMDIIAVWAARSGLQVMLVVGDNVDVTTRVERFRTLGLDSVPLMGLGGRSRRMDQIERVAISEATEEEPAWKDPRLTWTSPICPAIGFETSDVSAILPGLEPCESLYEQPDLKSTKRACPLMPACPVHLSRNWMMDASIWVGTPQSLFLTRAPMQSVEEEVRLLEAVYRECDLVIVDEADRVQAQLDEMFAPSIPLVDTNGNGLMEVLDRNTAAPEGGSLNKTVASNDVLDWSTSQRVSQQAANVLLNLCGTHSGLRKWITVREYFTAFGLASQLHTELTSSDGDAQIPEGILSFLSQPDMASPLQLLAMEVMWNRDEDSMRIRAVEAVKWLRGLYPPENVDTQNEALLQLKLRTIALTAFLDSRLKNVFDNWEVGEGAYSLGTGADLPFQRLSREYEALIPSSPTGNLFGFRYRWEHDPTGGDAQIEMFRCMGVGRWALTNLHDMFRAIDDASGPHVMLLSGSSWAPGSSSYHLQVPVDGLLLPPDDIVRTISASTASFDYGLNPTTHDPIRVSGSMGDIRQRNLISLLEFLTESGSDGTSHIHRELKKLSAIDASGNCILMVTGSYEEARRAYEYLNGRLDCGVRYLVRDNEGEFDEWSTNDSLRRGLVSRFAAHSEQILIAPLMAIERGHNIVSEDGRAVIGSVYFLIRPMPVPHQFSSAIRDMNHWAVTKWNRVELESGTILAGWNAYRKVANRVWEDILGDTRQFAHVKDDKRRNLVWTQLVALWQTVGRAVRGGSRVRVHFCDSAFAPESAKGRDDTERTSMLIAMRAELDRYLRDNPAEQTIDSQERKACRTLYAPWASTLSKIRNLDELQG